MLESSSDGLEVQLHRDGGLRDAEGLMQLRHVEPSPALLRTARLAGRLDSGKPIIDPVTREVIGYEIEPIADPTI